MKSSSPPKLWGRPKGMKLGLEGEMIEATGPVAV